MRKGERETDIKKLQQRLSGSDVKVSKDVKTEIVVKQFQTKPHLHVDGIVGRQAVGVMHISARGMTFIFRREAWANKSC